MQLLRLLISYWWPTRRTAQRVDGAANDNLKLFFAIAIVMLCGPEVFIASDLLLLLEFLGAGLFLLAFTAAFRILAGAVGEHLRRIFLPSDWWMLLTSRGQPRLVMHGGLLVARHGMQVLVFGAVAVAGILGALGSVV